MLRIGGWYRQRSESLALPIVPFPELCFVFFLFVVLSICVSITDGKPPLFKLIGNVQY